MCTWNYKKDVCVVVSLVKVYTYLLVIISVIYYLYYCIPHTNDIRFRFDTFTFNLYFKCLSQCKILDCIVLTLFKLT